MNKKNKTKQKKPFYKRWWFIVIVVIVVIGALGSDGDKDEADAPNEQEKEVAEVEEEQGQDVEEANEESKKDAEEDADISKESEEGLSDQELEDIKEKVEIEMTDGADAEYEDFEFIIDSYEFDQEQNTIKIRLIVTDDPLPTQKEVEEYTQDIAWYTGGATSDKNFNVRVSSALKFGEDEYAPLGTARFKNGETTFKEDKGLDVLD